MDSDPSRVSAAVLRYLADPTYTVYLSVVNVWEIVIKAMSGKLQLNRDIETIVADSLAKTPLQLLPVTLDHVFRVQGLPSHHKDPFDRILVAQALADGAVLLTADPLVRQYPVAAAW